MPTLCTIDGCDRDVVGRGLCNRHYQRAQADGTLHDHLRRQSPATVVVEVAERWGVHVSDILQGDPPQARWAAAQAVVELFPELPKTKVARLLCVSDVRSMLEREPGEPSGDARPPDDGACTVHGCDRDHDGHTGVRMCPGHRARWYRHADLRVDQPLRPIRRDGPILDLEVHDRRGYRKGCRCETCRAEAVLAVKRSRHRPRSLPAEQAAAAVRRLLDAGMTVADVARVAGMGRCAIDGWLHGSTARAFQTSYDKILAVEPPSATAVEPDTPTCEECGEPSLAGGRWCWPCYQGHANPRPLRRDAGCGSEAGYQRHIRAGTEPCRSCRSANAEAKGRRAA